MSSRVSRVEAVGDGATRRYTTADGLAGNIVSHLAVCGEVLWAACVDVCDEQKKAWGPGGLCRYDPQADRWVHVQTLAGKPVRWVSLLQARGDKLWVAFRLGEGLVGEKIAYGMGLYPGLYRPRATAIILGRLKGSKWMAGSREPIPEGYDRPGRSAPAGPPDGPPGGQPPRDPPTEIPAKLAVLGGKLLLYSETASTRPSGNFDLPMDGQVTELDLDSGQWRLFDVKKDFATDRLIDMHVEGGQAILIGEANVHQWILSADGVSRWRRLEPNCTLRGSWIQALAPIGREIWIGYGAYGYGYRGVQGISRYDTRTGRWAFLSSSDLGTSCTIQVIAAGPDDGAWVLFGHRAWMYMAGAAIAMPPRPVDVPATPGVGRFADGKWTFPVKLAGVPESIERSRRGPNGIETWTQPLSIENLAAVGGAVFVANQLGVYRGPGQWRKIHDGQVVRI